MSVVASCGPRGHRSANIRHASPALGARGGTRSTAALETAEELAVALEHADGRPLSAPPRTPLIEHPVLRWRAAARTLFVISLRLLYYVLLR